MRHSKLPACGMQHARRHLQLATPLADIIDGIRSALKAHYEYPHECSERILMVPTTDGPRLGTARRLAGKHLRQTICNNFSQSSAIIFHTQPQQQQHNNNNSRGSNRCSFTEFPLVFFFSFFLLSFLHFKRSSPTAFSFPFFQLECGECECTVISSSRVRSRESSLRYLH